MFGALYAADDIPIDALIGVAAEFSPRYEINGPRDVTLDLSGLARLFGSAHAIATELQRTASERGLTVRVAIAGTTTAARLLARGGHHSITVIDPGGEADALAPLPLAFLSDDSEELLTFRKWGLKTLGDIARLPADAVAARLGQAGVRWQRLARGEDPRPLLPAVPEERFEQALDLEWPIDGLEPLSFVLGRLMEPLAAHLDRRGRGAAVLHVQLQRAHAPHAGAARPRVASARRRHRPRRRGGRSDAGARAPVFAPHAAAPVAGAALHADGPPLGADGRGTLRLAGGRRFLGAGEVRDAAVCS